MEFCSKFCQNGHACYGLHGEVQCMSCLTCCHANQKHTTNDPCTICYTETLTSAPCIELTCGHIFHFECVGKILEGKWSGPRITFGFMQCPICKTMIHHDSLSNLLHPLKVLFDDVRTKALTRLQFEGLYSCDEVIRSGGPFYQDPAGYAMDKYAYYSCSKCHKAYYGGERQCAHDNGDDFNPDDLICPACVESSRVENCPEHGTDFIEYKCRYCCSIAVYYCFGTTHFCNSCHNNHTTVTGMSKDQLPKCPAGPVGKQLSGVGCPLGLNHPPTGDEFSLGCGLCNNMKCF